MHRITGVGFVECVGYVREKDQKRSSLLWKQVETRKPPDVLGGNTGLIVWSIDLPYTDSSSFASKLLVDEWVALKPLLDENHFTMTEVGSAYDRLVSGEAIGKVVVDVAVAD